MGLVHYIECENERDKWWKGRAAYQTAREYAANLSAFYDGNKNTMGAGVGVKNADPAMQVVMGGTASTQPDYVKGIIDWCKEFRGYNKDGSVNLCFDVINYHCYYNEGGGSQSFRSKQAIAPDLNGSDIADRFVALGREYNKEVWITETGYDINANSPLHVPAVGEKIPALVQGDWILRTALQNARSGISRTFFYNAYSEDNGSAKQFASSGLLTEQTLTRTIAADYLLQAKQMIGSLEYKETISRHPLVDLYEKKGKRYYVLVSPTQNNTTSSYSLPLRGVAKVAIHILAPGKDKATTEIKALTNGSLQVQVSETPVFVEVL